jgi:hypothetical protein
MSARQCRTSKTSQERFVVICKTWRLLNRVMHEDALGRLQQERHVIGLSSGVQVGTPSAVCDEVLYEMMSCGGMMVHAGASERLHELLAHLLQK